MAGTDHRVAMVAAMVVANGERAPGTWSRAASQAPHRPAPTPRALHEAEVTGRSPDLRTAAVAAADQGRGRRMPLGTDERCSTELRAGHSRTHLWQARLGGASTPSGTRRSADAVAVSPTRSRRR